MFRGEVINRMNFEAVIFDIDGTVWDIFPTYFQALSEGLKAYDIPPIDIDFLIAQLKAGESFNNIIDSLIKSVAPLINIAEFMKDVSSKYRDLEEGGVQLYPDALQLFPCLKIKNIKIGLATGRYSPRERIRKICLRMGIDHYIDAVTSQLYVQHQKPAPDLIIDCAYHLAVPIEKCLVVGDTKDDILAAKEAGGTGIGILTGKDNYEEMMKVKPFGGCQIICVNDFFVIHHGILLS
jgi:HAD superfamily hydrolase (TIGR01549 family)